MYTVRHSPSRNTPEGDSRFCQKNVQSNPAPATSSAPCEGDVVAGQVPLREDLVVGALLLDRGERFGQRAVQRLLALADRDAHLDAVEGFTGEPEGAGLLGQHVRGGLQRGAVAVHEAEPQLLEGVAVLRELPDVDGGPTGRRALRGLVGEVADDGRARLTGRLRAAQVVHAVDRG